MSQSYRFLNTSQTVPSSLDSFQITTPSDTDIWRTPPSRDVFSAPVLQRSMSVSEFRSARVSVKSEWIHLYDQGGLVITFPQKDGGKTKWIKGGVELMDGKPRVAVVATDRWSDCALQVHSRERVTIEFQRQINEDGQLGPKLWVWVVEGEQRSLIREITWVFEEGGTNEGTMTVGAYACRPHKGSGELVVSFSGFEVKTA